MWSKGNLERGFAPEDFRICYRPNGFRACRPKLLDVASTFPNRAVYQLNYTRLLNFPALLSVVKAGYKLYYYKRDDSSMEQDFFVRTASALIPVEVKAKNGTAKSMRTLIGSEKYADIHCGIKFISGNIGYSDDIYTFPYFCAFLLKRCLAGTNI